MAQDLIPRIKLEWKTIHQEQNPNNNEVVDEASDVIDIYDSENLDSVMSTEVLLLKDAASVQIVPTALPNLKFVYIRVMTDRIGDPDTITDGTIKAEITTDLDADQVLQGDLIVVKKKTADITSIKLTSNEDDSTGISLPVRIILGGKSS